MSMMNLMTNELSARLWQALETGGVDPVVLGMVVVLLALLCGEATLLVLAAVALCAHCGRWHTNEAEAWFCQHRHTRPAGADEVFRADSPAAHDRALSGDLRSQIQLFRLMQDTWPRQHIPGPSSLPSLPSIKPL